MNLNVFFVIENTMNSDTASVFYDWKKADRHRREMERFCNHDRLKSEPKRRWLIFGGIRLK